MYVRGERHKNKGRKLGRGKGGYGGGSLEAGKGQRRGKPYNFAKPQAPHSKPQPCAAKLRFLESKALSFEKSHFANPANSSQILLRNK